MFSRDEVDKPARILSSPKPGRTDASRINKTQGTVVLEVVLSSTGEVGKINVVRGLPDGLTEKAIEAARQIKFEPARKDGRAVSQMIKLEYSFSF